MLQRSVLNGRCLHRDSQSSRVVPLVVPRAFPRREPSRLPGQAETVLNPNDDAERLLLTLPVAESMKSYSDLDYLAVRHSCIEI